MRHADAFAEHARLLIVDDDLPLRDTLQDWLRGQRYAVDVATDGFEALARAREAVYDLVITELGVRGIDGLKLLAIFKELDPSTEFLFLTGQGTMEDAIAALREGRAFDFLKKPVQNLRELNIVIERALSRRAGEPRAAARRTPGALDGRGDWPTHVAPLTPRELAVMAAIAEGLENQAIADRLGLSCQTVRSYLARIYDKLGVRNRIQAILTCQQAGKI